MSSITRIQLWGNFLVGVALLISNNYLLPDGAFNDGVKHYSYMMITPSIILFLALFSMQYMDLIRIWAFLVAGTIAGSILILGVIH